jgi:hypothetical protein
MKSARTLHIAKHVHVREFDGELVVLHLKNGRYYGLDPISARLWRGIEAGKTLDAIVAEVAPQYDVDSNRLMDDLRSVEAEFLAEGLMVESP